MLMVPSTGTTPICSDCNVGWIRIRNPALGLAINFLEGNKNAHKNPKKNSMQFHENFVVATKN